jgi:hypothetical protein
MSRPLSKPERDRLLRIATSVDLEAQTWREGFAAFDGTVWTWPKTEEWAHVRCVRLEQSAAFLRTIAKRI